MTALTPASMEPLVLAGDSKKRSEAQELAHDLTRQSSALHHSIPAAIRPTLARLVRSMNCYYSNLIEGHNTHPIDIERALNGDYSAQPKKRNLQREALAHISVQEWIDASAVRGKTMTRDTLCDIHHRFCSQLPEDMLWVEDPATKKRLKVIPGQLRSDDVAVGNHVAPLHGDLATFLARFEDVYNNAGALEKITSAAAAHHRLLWIHPFLDGNGRVARLMSHATLLETLDTGSLWSIARGLGRNVQSYKDHLAACDMPRRNDYDGRGNLSEENLAEFTFFFLRVCLDQVDYMRKLMQPDRLEARVMTWAKEEVSRGVLPPQAIGILQAILHRGELPRGDVPAVIGATDRHGRRVITSLMDAKIITTEGTRAPLRLAFPAELADRLMPGLFPEKPQD